MHQGKCRSASLMFLDLTHYQLHRNYNRTRELVDVLGPGQRLTSIDAWDKPCVTARGQAEEARGVGEGGGYAAPGWAPSTRLPDSSTQSPGRQREGGVQGQSISRPQPSFTAVWWENLEVNSEVSPRSVEHMALGLIRFVQR